MHGHINFILDSIFFHKIQVFDCIMVAFRTRSCHAKRWPTLPCHVRSKHFDIENHFVREKTEFGIIHVKYCPTNDMLADILTKALPRVKHEGFTQAMGLLPA